MNRLRQKILLLLLGLSLSAPSYAQWAVFDGTSFGQLLMIVSEAQKRYSQLKGMMNDAKNHQTLIKKVNQGILNSTGLLESFGVEDDGILKDLKSLNQAISTIDEIYGKIPKSKEALMHVLHDQTVAESLRMINSFKEYSKQQEENSIMIRTQARDASPKGAQRMTAESNALILQGISQLIRLQNQSLKMQSEQFAMRNKQEKESVATYQRINSQLDSAFKTLKVGGKLPRF